MSTLATVTVIQCDGCMDVAVLQETDDYASFEANWFDGWRTHFCTPCKVKPEHAAAIAADEDLSGDISEAMQALAEPEIEEIHDGH